MKETDIQRAICDYLALKQNRGALLFWRNNNVPIFDVSRKAFRALPKYTPKGLPDILCLKEGTFIGIEVKMPKAYQSPEQKQFERDIKEHGGEYLVARSVDDVVNWGL